MTAHKYSELSEWILNNIRKQVFRPGDKLPTEESLTKQFSVSRYAVRQSLKNLIDLGYLESVRGSGTYVKGLFREDAFGEDGTGRNVIVMVLSDDKNYIFPEIASGAGEYLNKEGYMLNILFTDGDFFSEREKLKFILEIRPAGVLIEAASSGMQSYNEDLYKELVKQIPTIFLNTDRPVIGQALSLKDRTGGKILAEYLIRMGHTKIGSIFAFDEQTAQLRYLGLLDALVEHNIAYSRDHEIWRRRRDMNNLFQNSGSTVQKALSDVTAVFCHDDRIAYRLIGMLNHLGKKVPEDISVVGYDDSFYSTIDTGITSVKHPKYDYGKNLARAILDLIRFPEEFSIADYVTEPELVIRDSVKDLRETEIKGNERRREEIECGTE